MIKRWYLYHSSHGTCEKRSEKKRTIIPIHWGDYHIPHIQPAIKNCFQPWWHFFWNTIIIFLVAIMLIDISSSLLKATTLSVALPLSHIFNLSIKSHLFPQSWKFSHIIPIPKCSPPSPSPSNFCPISLLSLVSKLLEKHIHSILLKHCYQHDLLWSRN